MASRAKARGLSVKARSEYVQAMRKRYRAAAGRRAKSALLDELVDVAGFDRKYAITLMNQAPTRKPAAGKRRSGRPRAYQRCLSVIELAWEVLDFCCAERLHPQLLPLATALARHGEVELTREVREELERISRATLARRLAELPRPKPRLLRSAPHPNRILASQVQVDRYRWNEDRPGALEVDLVEHNGGSTGGHYACTLSIVDVVSGWSARRAVMGKSQALVGEAFESLLADWPSAVWAVHSDNGSEFVGRHLMRYCAEHGITFHRSRPYQKNDNAHVEQKNRQLVREVVGYDRIDTPAGLAWLNAVYDVVAVYANLVLPSLKLVGKTRVGSRVSKRYDTARTPFDRLLGHGAVQPHRLEDLARQQHVMNPLALRRTLDRLQRQGPQSLDLRQAAD
jgi:transposase InsO family protein